VIAFADQAATVYYTFGKALGPGRKLQYRGVPLQDAGSLIRVGSGDGEDGTCMYDSAWFPVDHVDVT
jgi:hypothetical protein